MKGDHLKALMSEWTNVYEHFCRFIQDDTNHIHTKKLADWTFPAQQR